MEQKYKTLIAQEFRACVQGTNERVSENETYRPFHTALLSEEVIFWSRFERSFTTSFGQRVIEEIARIVALSNGATQAQRQKVTLITLDEAWINGVSQHIQSLRDGTCQDQSWDATLAQLRAIPLSGKTRQIRVISDLWWKKNGIDYYASLKTVKPNIDQTAVAKEDCLHLALADSKCKAYFGLPYNPYGEAKTDYAFNPPMGIFDFHKDSVVLIGKEMWDTIGGTGCYDEILEIAKAVGTETKKSISDLLKKQGK